MRCECPHVPEPTAAALAEKLIAPAPLDLAHGRRRPGSALGVGALDVSSDTLRRLEGRGTLGAADGCAQCTLGCVILISAFCCLREEGNFAQLGNI